MRHSKQFFIIFTKDMWLYWIPCECPYTKNFFIYISRRLSLFDFATQTSTTMVSSNLINWNLSLVVIAGVAILDGGGGRCGRGEGCMLTSHD